MLYHQFTIHVADPFRSALINRLMAIGSLGIVEHEDSVVAYFSENLSLSDIESELEIIRALIDRSGAGPPCIVTYDRLPDVDWNESWKRSFKPVDVGNRFTVLPPWEKPIGDRIPLIIDPGMAFGTGHHGTTRSCLVLMERYAPAVARERFLDLGTGTGLLAIAARALGFKAVIGVDIDPLAIEASRRNIQLNRTEGIELIEGAISAAAGTYDMITANLISGTLVELADEIAARSGPSGIVIMSGILDGQDQEVEAAAEKAGLHCAERLRDGKWVTLAFRR